MKLSYSDNLISCGWDIMVEDKDIELKYSKKPESPKKSPKKRNNRYNSIDQSQDIQSLKASISDFTTSLKNLNLASINFDEKNSPIYKKLNEIIDAIDELNIPDAINSKESYVLEEEFKSLEKALNSLPLGSFMDESLLDDPDSLKENIKRFKNQLQSIPKEQQLMLEDGYKPFFQELEDIYYKLFDGMENPTQEEKLQRVLEFINELVATEKDPNKNNEKNAELTDQLNRTTHQKDLLKTLFDSLVKEGELSTEDMNTGNLEEYVNQIRDTIKKLKEDKEELIKITRDEVRSELLKEQEALVLSIEELRREEKELSEEIDELGENKNSLTYKLTQTADENNKLSAKVQELENNLKNYQLLANPSPNQANLLGDLAKKDRTIEELKTKLEESHSKNASTEDVAEENELLKLRLSQLKEDLKELQSLQNPNDNIVDEDDPGQADILSGIRINQLSEKNSELEASLKTLQNERDNLKSQLGELHLENQTQKKMLGTLKQENEKLKVNADNKEYIHQKIDGARAPEPKKYEYSVQNQPSIKKLKTSAETIETEVPVQYDYETSSIPGKKQEFEYVVSSQKNIKQEKESFEHIQDSKAVPKKNSSIVMESFQTIGDKESSDQGTKTERELKYAVVPIMDINSHQKTTTSIETNTDFGTSSMITNTFNGGEKRSIGINTKIEEVNNAIANKTLFRKVLEEKLLNDFKIKSLDKLVATEKSQYTFREYQLSHHNPDKIMGTDKVEREEVMKNVHEKVKKSHIEPVQEVDQHLYKLGENVTLKLEMDGDKVKFNIDELVSGKATCCISIPRVDGNGAKLNNYDIIEFKDGKMTDYLFSKEGQSQLSEQQIKQMKGLDEKQRAVLLNKGGPWVEKLQTPQTHSTHITNLI